MKDNICLAFCGVCRAKSSSALSLKTVPRTVFFTLAFESGHHAKVKNNSTYPSGYVLLLARVFIADLFNRQNSAYYYTYNCYYSGNNTD